MEKKAQPKRRQARIGRHRQDRQSTGKVKDSEPCGWWDAPYCSARRSLDSRYERRLRQRKSARLEKKKSK